MQQVTAATPRANWIDAAGRAIQNVTKPLANKTTKRYEKAVDTAANDWSSLCIAAARGEGEPTPEVITAVAAGIGIDAASAVTTFRSDVEQCDSGMQALRKAPDVLAKRADSLHGMSESEFFQELKAEKAAIRKRQWEIQHELHLASARAQELAANKVAIDRAARNARVFPNGRDDIAAAIESKTTDG